jgi:hypothetical protein
VCVRARAHAGREGGEGDGRAASECAGAERARADGGHMCGVHITRLVFATSIYDRSNVQSRRISMTLRDVPPSVGGDAELCTFFSRGRDLLGVVAWGF